MMKAMAGWIALSGPVLFLLACAGQPAGAQDTAQVTFRSEEYGFAIAFPADFDVHPYFESSYMQQGLWKTYARAGPPGQAVVALVLEGSVPASHAALRIGVSRNGKALATCEQPSFGTSRASFHTTQLDSIDFVAFTAGGVGAGNFMTVRSYRAVHNGACYAIDLLLFGRSSFTPGGKSSFTREGALERMDVALAGFRFITGEEQ